MNHSILLTFPEQTPTNIGLFGKSFPFSPTEGLIVFFTANFTLNPHDHYIF
jgi:hypothetical protein